jgi:short-subunit dehydrogenase
MEVGMDKLDGRTALVTGGSSGIGVDIARELAARGADVMLVARREEKLREVADAIVDDFGVEADWVVQDLARQQAADELYEEVSERGVEVDILVNNAGFGIYGNFMDNDGDRQMSMMNLNMVTPVRLTKLFGREMIEREWGRVMQVASIGAFQPSPTYGLYSATKAFLLNWGEAIDFELAGTGVSCTVVCPGVTRTEFFDHVDQDRTWYQKLTMMESETVATKAVTSTLNQRMSVVPGWMNFLAVWTVRLFPRRFVRWFAYQTMRDES